MRRLFACFGVALALAPAAHATGNARLIDGPLRFEAANQTDHELAARMARWVDGSAPVATDADARGEWVATDGEVIIANGRTYRYALGARPWAAIAPDGAWAAGGADGVLVSGTFFPGAAFAETVRQQFGRLRAPEPRSVVAAASSITVASEPATRLFAESAALDATVIRDTVPPLVTRVELILFPDDPARRRVVPVGTNVFVGAQTVGIRVTMNEKMATPPRVVLTQVGFNTVEAPLTDANANPVFEYRIFPMGAPGNNGPVKLEVQGKNDGQPPVFGTDLAGNPIQAGSPGSLEAAAFIVDTVAPDLRRVDLSVPGNFRTLPKENSTLPKQGFPKELLVLVADYNQPDDGTFTGANVATDKASGVDFDKAGVPGSGIDVKLFDPRGREIKGTLVSQPPSALRVLLPDVYDPAQGVFPDTDSDGVADPIEGTYRIQVDLADRSGNGTAKSLSFGEDTTPLKSAALSVSIKPVFSEPFPNPKNPIGERGTAVKKLESIEITSDSPDFDAARTTAELLTSLVGPGLMLRPMKTTITRQGKLIIVKVERDQDGNGQPDFENPPPGPFLPPGEVDPRLGKNDGQYLVRVKAFDTAGNSSTLEREILLDTTAPEVGDTFPKKEQKIGPNVRFVDALLKDPRASSGRDGAGIQLDASQIKLRFQGNAQTPAQFIRGIVFLHRPNDSDPTQPDYNKDDHFPKILYQIVDKNGDSVPLPRDGTFDGVYEISVNARDQAGNEASAVTTFAYSSKITTGTTSVIAISPLVSLRTRFE